MFEWSGGLHRGLVTLPCPTMSTEVTVRITEGAPAWTVDPPWKTKALRAALATAGILGTGAAGGTVSVRSNIPSGFGMGSSTSDVTATIRAVLNAFGRDLPTSRIARIAVEAERAADPLMFDRMLLFAHREGMIIEDLHVRMPPMKVLGFVARPDPVETLAFTPARYSSWEIECFRALRGLLRRGAREGSVQALGRVATASARLNQRFLRVDRFASLLQVMADSGAAGIQVAHSGSVVGLVFDAADPDLARKTALASRGLLRVGISRTWEFCTEGDDEHLPDP
ncbi:GHMP kinase [Sphaerisporangium sp. B11E5]|uniref:GHMP family kinase ATP-binding protein n=1 Tax=Sphaerisporangium sp. B11E5 TaxID=3153563 RepID=UPI00325FA374